MADFEEFEKGISRLEANAEDLLAKISKLTAAQSYFLQSEIRRFWEQNNTENSINMNEFISSLQKQ